MNLLNIKYYAFSLSNFIAKTRNESHAKRYEYYYGSLILLETIFQLVLFLVIGLAFNILKEVMISLLAFGTLRFYAGGYHANTFKKCTLFSLVIILSSVFLSQYILNFMNIILIIISIVVLYIYAPTDHKNKPITNEAQRSKFKIISIFIFVIWILLGTFLLKDYSLLINISLLFESLSLIKVSTMPKFGK